MESSIASPGETRSKRSPGSGGGLCPPAALDRAGIRRSPLRGSLLQAVLRDRRGQSTVEFAVVMAGFLSLMVALSLLWHALGDGLLVKHALAVASHHVQAVLPTTVADIFLY